MWCLAGTFLLAIAIAFLYKWFNEYYRRHFLSDFNSKYVFITGCDSGFGEKLAIDLDKRGLYIFAGCYTENGAEELKKRTSNRLKTIHLDVTDQLSVDEAKKFVEANLPNEKQLWGLVNNAGILGNISFELATLEDYKNIMEVNCYGIIRVTDAFWPLIKRSRGRIVNIISICGRGVFGFVPYSCSKFAVQPYTDGLRRSLRTSGVKVVTIEPGLCIDTEIAAENAWTSLISKRWAELPEWKQAHFEENFDKREIQLYRSLIDIWPLHKRNRKELVTDVLTHALGSTNPKTRYAVGYDARLFITVCWFSPDWLLDAILRFAKMVAKLRS
ncbi:Dehydrogenase/reductase SDR member 9 [Chamberlinius hualienensis]